MEINVFKTEIIIYGEIKYNGLSLFYKRCVGKYIEFYLNPDFTVKLNYIDSEYKSLVDYLINYYK